MATSGSYDWVLTRDQIIAAALRKIGALAQGDTPSGVQIIEASESLNAMVKEWENDGVRLWLVEWVTQAFSAASEVTGTDGKIYTCIRSHTSTASNKPVTGSDYTTYWVERGSSGGVWATATAYSAIGDFALAGDTIGIDRAFIRDGKTDDPVSVVSFERYFDIWDKSANGKPTAITVNKAESRAYLNYQPDKTSYVLHYLRVRMPQDFDAAANTPDFPVRWELALIFGLADILGVEHGLPETSQRALAGRAKYYKDRALGGDNQRTDDSFVVSAY